MLISASSWRWLYDALRGHEEGRWGDCTTVAGEWERARAFSVGLLLVLLWRWDKTFPRLAKKPVDPFVWASVPWKGG